MTGHEKGAPVAGTTKSSKCEINTLYCITWLMVVATIIAGWNIKDIWSGVVAGICGVVTVLMTIEILGGQR